jgi:2-C-methyl-D-erythritol 4-phosphate cytidylyltransferase
MTDGGARAAAILLAAGAGKRLGAERPKALLPIGERTMLAVAAAGAAASPKIGAIVVAAPPGYEEEARSCVEGLPVPTTILTGGRTRQASVRAALTALAADAEIVVVLSLIQKKK